MEDITPIRIKITISNISGSKSIEPQDFSKPVGFTVNTNLEENEREINKVQLKFMFMIITDPRIVKYNLEGITEMEGPIEHVNKMLVPHPITKVPMILHDIYQQIYPSIFMLSKIMDSPCPSPDLLNKNRILVPDTNNSPEIQKSSVPSPETPGEKLPAVT